MAKTENERRLKAQHLAKAENESLKMSKIYHGGSQLAIEAKMWYLTKEKTISDGENGGKYSQWRKAGNCQ